MPLMSGYPPSPTSGYEPPTDPPVTCVPRFSLAARFSLDQKTCIRLHPRAASVPDKLASKIGGVFAWPRDQTWPVCSEHNEPKLTVLQIRRSDVPELPFPGGTDLFQLLWCPEYHVPPGYGPDITTRWRTEAEISGETLDVMPEPNTPFPTVDNVPRECMLFPERVQEEDGVALYEDPRLEQMEQWVKDNCKGDFDDLLVPDEHDYRELHSLYGTSRCTKIGGYSGCDDIPNCACGTPMSHLLTMTGEEYGDSHTTYRWAPSDLRTNEDGKLKNLPYCGTGLGLYVSIFICTRCPDLPTTTYLNR